MKKNELKRIADCLEWLCELKYYEMAQQNPSIQDTVNPDPPKPPPGGGGD